MIFYSLADCDKPVVNADDPDTIQFIQAVGAVPAKILAPE